MSGPIRRILNTGLLGQAEPPFEPLHYDNVVKVEIVPEDGLVRVYFPDGDLEEFGSIEEWKITPGGQSKVKRIYGTCVYKPIIRIFGSEDNPFTVDIREEESESVRKKTTRTIKCIIS